MAKINSGAGRQSRPSEEQRGQKIAKVGVSESEVSKGQRPGAGAKTTPAPPSKPPMQSLPPTSQQSSEGSAQDS